MKVTIIFMSHTWGLQCQRWCFLETTLSLNKKTLWLQTQLENKTPGPDYRTLKIFRQILLPYPLQKQRISFIWNNMVRQCVEYCAPIVIVIAKRGYFSSPSDIPVTTMLLSTLIPTNFSAVLLWVKCLYRSWTLLPLTEQPLGRVAPQAEKKEIMLCT